jgi:mRNA-degrading endonuclease toxin of MazEF toxin-antitoxin module
VKRGDIFVVDLGPGLGDEIRGVRPVVILSADVFLVAPRFVIVVPAVNADEVVARIGVPVSRAESGYPVDLAVLAERPRALDPTRFTSGPVGVIARYVMERIGFKLALQTDVVGVKTPTS